MLGPPTSTPTGARRAPRGCVDEGAQDADNAQLARQLLSAFDRLSFEEARRLCHPEVEFTSPLARIWGLRGDGYELLREWFERFNRDWAFIELRALGGRSHGSWVLGRVRTRARGKVSASELEWTLFVAAQIVDGRARRIGAYLTAEEALEAAAEPAASNA